MSTSKRRELFERWAARYDTALHDGNDFPFGGYAPVQESMIARAQLQPGLRVADMGTGTGNVARLLADAGCRVWGVDFAAAMLAVARSKVPGATFLQADLGAGWAPGLPEKVDRIFAGYVLHEFELVEKVRLLVAWAAHLAPGGRIVVGDIAFPDVARRAQAREWWRDRWDDDEFYWAADEAGAALAAEGLRAEYEQVSSCAGVLVVELAETP